MQPTLDDFVNAYIAAFIKILKPNATTLGILQDQREKFRPRKHGYDDSLDFLDVAQEMGKTIALPNELKINFTATTEEEMIDGPSIEQVYDGLSWAKQS